METENTRILLIDDDEDFRGYVHDLLKKRGFEVLIASNGKEGVDIIKNEKVDLVLTDMVMPEKEGVETIMELKLEYPDVKVIAMSGAMRKDTYLKLADNLGAHIILSKPFKKEVLLTAIEEM